MAYQQKDNSGSVFRNDRKREGKKDADFAGSCMVNGVEFWVDMWTKPPNGDKKGFFSLSFRQKDAHRNQEPESRHAQQRSTHPPRATPPPPPPKYNDPDLDMASEDDLPF